MATRLNPYLSFTDTARAAMEFYRDTFGGTLVLSTFGEYGQAGSPVEHLIMHAMLETPSGFTLMASDTPPGMVLTPGSTIAISLSGDDEAELRGYWERLVAGGSVTTPLEPQLWGDTFGMCTDRFGIAWMVDITAAAA
ncbi:MAG: VOC family protein [Candidatus Nanopelagicales bacterium]